MCVSEVSCDVVVNWKDGSGKERVRLVVVGGGGRWMDGWVGEYMLSVWDGAGRGKGERRA
jgi:hypothetical protein